MTKNNWPAAVRAHLMAGEQENRTYASILTTTLSSPKEERKGYAGIFRAYKEGPGIIPSKYIVEMVTLSSRLVKRTSELEGY